MRRTSRLIARVAIAILAVIAGCVVAPSIPAQAATIPPLQFPAVQLAPGLAYPPHAISQPNGGVTVGGCGSNGGNTNGFAQYGATGTSTDVATLTIGGNDIDFVAYATACVDPNSSCDGQMHDNTIAKIQNDLPGKLDTLFGSIKNKVGTQARVLVIGYPLIMPDASTPTTWPDCVYMSGSEKTAARDVITRLNQAVHDAASRAGARFEYVDPNNASSPFKGHELCNDGSFFNGTTAPPNLVYSFHPNANGQEAYRKVVETYLAG